MASIDTFCKLQAASKQDGRSTAGSTLPATANGELLHITDNAIRWPGSSKTTDFNKVFSPETKNHEVYTAAVEPLVRFFLNGYNVSLMIVGESHSGQRPLLSGDISKSLLRTKKQVGLLAEISEQIWEGFSAVPATAAKQSSKARDSGRTGTSQPPNILYAKCVEVENENVQDLFQSRSITSTSQSRRNEGM